jgi:hypothetical protein
MFRHLYVTFRGFNICASLIYIKFLKLKLLKLQFHNINRLKYIKILFGRRLVIE